MFFNLSVLCVLSFSSRDETGFRAESCTEDIKLMLERKGEDSEAKMTSEHKR